MSQNRKVLQNKLKQFSVVQFDANRILMQHRKTKQKFVYREIFLHDASFLAELVHRAAFRHQNLIALNYHSDGSQENKLGVLFEYHISDLQKQLTNRSKSKSLFKDQDLLFSEEQLLNTFIPILQCIKQYHKSGRLHGFIKPKNIVITEDYEMKLCDAFVLGDQLTHDTITSKAYYSPQYLKNKIFTKDCDLWALGMIILHCASLQSSQCYYNRNTINIQSQKIQNKLIEIQSKYSDEFIIGLKLLLSARPTLRNVGLEILITKVLPEIPEIAQLKPKRLKKILQQIKCESLSPKKTLDLANLNNTPVRLQFREKVMMTPCSSETDKKLTVRENENKLEEKRCKIEQLKEKFKSKMNQQSQLKKKQIEKINKIIERSNAFVNQLLVKKLEKHQKQRSKMPSLTKTATLCTSSNVIPNNENKQKTLLKQDSFSIKKKQPVPTNTIVSKQSPNKQQRDRLLQIEKLRSASRKK